MALAPIDLAGLARETTTTGQSATLGQAIATAWERRWIDFDRERRLNRVLRAVEEGADFGVLLAVPRALIPGGWHVRRIVDADPGWRVEIGYCHGSRHEEIAATHRLETMATLLAVLKAREVVGG